MRSAVRVCLALALAGAVAGGANAAPGRGEAARAKGELAVVVHAGTPVTALTFGELRHLFLGERKYWEQGLPVQPLMPAAGTRERAAVLARIYEMTEARWKQYWVGRIMRDESTARPRTAATAEAVAKLAAGLPGSITVMDAAEVPAGLKVVRIDGLLPGEERYPLK